MCWLNSQGATPRNVIAQDEVKRSPESGDSNLTEALPRLREASAEQGKGDTLLHNGYKP